MSEREQILANTTMEQVLMEVEPPNHSIAQLEVPPVEKPPVSGPDISFFPALERIIVIKYSTSREMIRCTTEKISSKVPISDILEVLRPDSTFVREQSVQALKHVWLLKGLAHYLDPTVLTIDVTGGGIIGNKIEDLSIDALRQEPSLLNEAYHPVRQDTSVLLFKVKISVELFNPGRKYSHVKRRLFRDVFLDELCKPLVDLSIDAYRSELEMIRVVPDNIDLRMEELRKKIRSIGNNLIRAPKHTNLTIQNVDPPDDDDEDFDDLLQTPSPISPESVDTSSQLSGYLDKPCQRSHRERTLSRSRSQTSLQENSETEVQTRVPSPHQLLQARKKKAKRRSKKLRQLRKEKDLRAATPKDLEPEPEKKLGRSSRSDLSGVTSSTSKSRDAAANLPGKSKKKQA